MFKPKAWYSKERDYEYEGIKVYRFPVVELPSNLLPGLFNWLSIRFFSRKLRELSIPLENIAVVHAHVTGFGIFANATKRKKPKLTTLLQHHGFDMLSLENGVLRNFPPHRNWVKKYGIKICNQIDLHLGVSNKTLSYLKVYRGLKAQDTYVLYNGVDKSKFYRKPSEKKESQIFTIGCIANFWPLKDQITLLKAVRLLISRGTTDIRVLLVGTGATLEQCKQYAEAQGLTPYVTFIPEIPHNELVDFYNELDLFVLPSYYEAFGCVYTEAHACGVPFMAVKDQGITELIPADQGSQWLIEKGDYDRLSENILQFMTDRPKQVLKIDYDINALIKAFIKKVQAINSDAER